ncbi:MAG: hypothetical protein ACI9T7_002680 [Oleiphilaceae bacterium]|jgi:hypothetical protein
MLKASNVPKARILIVDDEFINIEILDAGLSDK